MRLKKKKEKQSIRVTFSASSRPRNTFFCYLKGFKSPNKLAQRDTISVMLGCKGPSGHPSVTVRKRHAETRVLTLVALVEIQPDAKSLQIGVGMRRQHKDKRLDKILIKRKKNPESYNWFL